MNDIIIILLCGLYVVCEAFIAYLGFSKFHWSSEFARKFIHIMTANLVLPVVYCSTTLPGKLFGPVLFIVVNYCASTFGLGKLLGMTDAKRHIGLVVYPCSVLLLVFLSAKGWMSDASAVSGVFIMGWGDGLAGIVGTAFGKHKYTVLGKFHKSIEGSLAMAAAVFVVVMVVAKPPVWIALAMALFSTTVENVSPSGLDNFSVPVLSALLLEVLCTL